MSLPSKARIRHSLAVCALLCMSSWSPLAWPVPSWHMNWLVMELPDPDQPPAAQVMEDLVKRAENDDWIARQQFATAYLYDVWIANIGARHTGCGNLPRGYHCRALARYPELGKKYLQELVDLDASGPVPPERLARYQSDYAGRALADARPAYETSSTSCKRAVKYYSAAVQNELILDRGQNCSARRLQYMFKLGTCVPVDGEKEVLYAKLVGGCPID